MSDLPGLLYPRNDRRELRRPSISNGHSNESRTDTSLTDKALWTLVRNGDDDAYGELFERHYKRVLTHCFHRTASTAMAEDLASVTFLEVWRKRYDVELENESALPWILGIATNVCRNSARSQGRHRNFLARFRLSITDEDTEDDLARRLDAERRVAVVLKSLERLSLEDRELITMCVWEGLEYAEVAAILKVPVGTVRSRLARARGRLKTAELAQSNGHLQDDNKRNTWRRVTND